MKKRMAKLIATLMVSAIMTTVGGVTAFAYVDPTAETQTEAEPTVTETEAVLPEETEEAPNTDGSAFTVPGNAQLQDDITDDSSKEFLTIQTKNNNTFYVIIDRSANTENVYMLSQIDENDLAKFLDEGTLTGSSVVTANPGVVLEEKEVEPTTPETEKPEEKEEEKPATGNAAGMFAILAVALCGVGAYYYFKIYKPRTEEDDSDDECIELSDDMNEVYEDEEDFD